MNWQTYKYMFKISPPSCMAGVVNISSPSFVEVSVVCISDAVCKNKWV